MQCLFSLQVMKVFPYQIQQLFVIRKFSNKQCILTGLTQKVAFRASTPLRYSVINIKGFLSVTAPKN